MLSNQATIARIKADRARTEMERAEAARKKATTDYEAAWATYRDLAYADGWCPFCVPAAPVARCPGHAFYADSKAVEEGE
jgi:hypothetical protein